MRIGNLTMSRCKVSKVTIHQHEVYLKTPNPLYSNINIELVRPQYKLYRMTMPQRKSSSIKSPYVIKLCLVIL